MPLPTRSYHTQCHASLLGIPYTMPWPLGHTICQSGINIYHVMHARPYIHHAMSIQVNFHIPCHALPGHTKYHVIPIRPYDKQCHSRQAIPYTMPCLPGHKKEMSARPYHIPWLACQAIPCIMSCSQAIPYIMTCSVGHTIYHVMPARSYYIPCHVGSRSGRSSITPLKAEMVSVRNVSIPGARLLCQYS